MRGILRGSFSALLLACVSCIILFRIIVSRVQGVDLEYPRCIYVVLPASRM